MLNNFLYNAHMTWFDWFQLPVILACGPGLMIVLGMAGKKIGLARNIQFKTFGNAVGSIVLALPMFYLGFTMKITNFESLGLTSFSWWWLPATLGFAVVLILLNAGITLGYQSLFKINEDKLVSNERSSFFTNTVKTTSGLASTLLFGGLLAPVCEELFFRGLLLSWFLLHFHPLIGVASTAIIFGAAHYDSPGVIVTGVIDGIILSYLFLIFGSLWIPILVHVFNNSIGLVAFAIESNKAKTHSETIEPDTTQIVSNENNIPIIDGQERQDTDEEKIQVRPEQDTTS